MTNKVIYLHIEKSAGTSFRVFAKSKVRDEEFVFWWNPETKGTEFEAPKFKKAYIIGGHRNIGFYKDMNALYLGVVREPKERVISLFNYHSTRDIMQAEGFDIDSLEKTIENCKAFRDKIANGQCKFLGGKPSFESVVEMIRSRPFIVGSFDYIEKFNECFFGAVDVPTERFSKANVGQPGYKDRLSISDNVHALLDDLLGEDYKLYKFINDECGGLFKNYLKKVAWYEIRKAFHEERVLTANGIAEDVVASIGNNCDVDLAKSLAGEIYSSVRKEFLSVEVDGVVRLPGLGRFVKLDGEKGKGGLLQFYPAPPPKKVADLSIADFGRKKPVGNEVLSSIKEGGNPYQSLDESKFWSPAVAKKSMFDISHLWSPRFKIGPNMRVATYGSCFAQHIGRALAARNFNWMITEPAPKGLSEENSKKFNYGIFSARTGNIYTTTLLAQWVSWATGEASPPDEVWEKDGRYYDPFRPNIEPNGFESREEMKVSRSLAIDAFKKSILECDVLVFTMGLTESWFHAEGGYEYPMCPGTVAGEFDEKTHQFVNQGYPQIRKALVSCLSGIKKLNPKVKVLLTVSPVPLTATMSGNHVLVATMESKSILRAVAGSVASDFRFVDYFPSYEIINSAPYKGAFFEPNLRSVNPVGVNHVMDQFFSCLQDKFPLKLPEKRVVDAGSGDAVCEEELLNAFQGGGK